MADRKSSKSPTLDRRALLAGTAAAIAGAATLTWAGKARAFTEEPADAKARALYLSACGARDDHKQLVLDANAALAAHQAERLRQFDINAQGVACPVCGCRVALNRSGPDAVDGTKN